MLIDLQRTFSEFNPPAGAQDDFEQGWREAFHLHQHVTWSELHKRALVVVLGEAGIGKTIEFRSEVSRLNAQAKAAFFLPLNLLSSVDSWHLALREHAADYLAWESSEGTGHFFLDSVDESRLKSHADFERALSVVQRMLGPHFGRARIAISSRITDWSCDAVGCAVRSYLAEPMQRAATAAEPHQHLAPEAATAPEAFNVQANQPAKVELQVVTLDPLSTAEARRCALAFGVEDAEGFWSAVSDGEYEFMASRPLDLRWMVTLWNQRRTLGTYAQLIEANIANRLLEFNPSYQAAGEVLSADELRAGATELAAAAEFGGCSYFCTDEGWETVAGVLAPDAVLTGWKPTAIRRLLATAIFDEASYGRVQFHHRSIREYLAACWVSRQLTLGVPLQRIQPLFAGRPFDNPVLISSRRAALSWLAATNVQTREWVTRQHPEILCFEGDPQSWDRPSADTAFANVVKAGADGVQLKWFSTASEYMRLGRSVTPGRIASVIADRSAPPYLRTLCFRIAWHASLLECADAAFDVYRDSSAEPRLRRGALEVLARVASPGQRQSILDDLTSGTLNGNDLISEALTVAHWTELLPVQLSAIFDATQREEDTGYGPMAGTIKRQLLPASDLPAALLLLSAVMGSLPRPSAGKRFARFPESEQPERAWLLSALTACFERVLELLPPTPDKVDEVCLEAAERIEAMRDSGFTNRTELDRLHEAIARHPALRWKVALAIAQSNDIRASLHRLTWGSSCLVSFDSEDLPELTERANNTNVVPDEREIWFRVAMYIVFGTTRGHARVARLRALTTPAHGTARFSAVLEQYARECQGARSSRQWRADDLQRKREAERQHAKFRAQVAENVAAIRAGTHQGWLLNLLQYAFSRFRGRDYSDVDFDQMASDFGSEIAESFRLGLMAFWPTVAAPDPADFTDGQVPWVALLALAGVNCSLMDDSAAAALPAELVCKAARLSVWELSGPRPWFVWLARSNPALVAGELAPWLACDARADGNGTRRTMETALRCPPDARKALLEPLVPLVVGDEIQRRDTLKAVISALRQDGLLSSADAAALCRSRMPGCIGTDGRLTDVTWLRLWMETDAAAAWQWFTTHLGTVAARAESELVAFASAVADLKWVQLPLSQATADVLVQLHARLGALTGVQTPSGEESDFFGPPQKHLRDAIPNLFVATRGRIGHAALTAVVPAYSSQEEIRWLRGRVAEHASLDLEQTAPRRAAELRSIGSPFLQPPTTEAQLFEQGLARLQEIRINLEEGPFSERDLFYRGIPEKFLQRWLAAKLRDTQNRRFDVHREEEVDNENMPDVQLSCAAGNVCLEVKPLDTTRNYSANSLTDTLETQMVGQYLRGTNSSRGILVLMQLDNKTWVIPGVGAEQPFEALVTYLQEQATRIKHDSPNVQELLVFGIRCIA